MIKYLLLTYLLVGCTDESETKKSDYKPQRSTGECIEPKSVNFCCISHYKILEVKDDAYRLSAWANKSWTEYDYFPAQFMDANYQLAQCPQTGSL